MKQRRSGEIIKMRISNVAPASAELSIAKTWPFSTFAYLLKIAQHVYLHTGFIA